MGPPSETPNTAARADPAASMTARTSSIRCSSEGSRSAGTRSDIPVPRLSKMSTRAISASRSKKRTHSGWCHMKPRWVTQPMT